MSEAIKVPASIKGEIKVVPARTMGHLQDEERFIGISLPYGTPAQRELVDFIVAACNAAIRTN